MDANEFKKTVYDMRCYERAYFRGRNVKALNAVNRFRKYLSEEIDRTRKVIPADKKIVDNPDYDFFCVVEEMLRLTGKYLSMKRHGGYDGISMKAAIKDLSKKEKVVDEMLERWNRKKQKETGKVTKYKVVMSGILGTGCVYESFDRSLVISEYYSRQQFAVDGTHFNMASEEIPLEDLKK